MSTTKWVSTAQMADALGVRSRTVHRYLAEKNFFKEGIHYRRRTPAPQAPWSWDYERTLETWTNALGKGVQA